MAQISDRVNRLAASATFAMMQKSNELSAQGVDVVNMSVGEPDFNTPDYVKKAAIEAVEQNYSKYSPVPGYMWLRKACSDKLKRENNLDYSPAEILVSTGAKQSLCNVIMAVVNPGDEVLLPSPCWVSYPEMVKLAGGVPVVIKAGIDQDFKVTAAQIEAAITPKTKAMMICSPSNPTGSVYSKDELESIAQVLRKYPDVFVVSDEIYEHINFIGGHQSMAQFLDKDRIAVINGVSKAYAMTGWRIGYCASNETISKVISNYLSHSTGSPCSISQWASVEALNGDQSSVKAMRDEFKKRRDYMANAINNITGVSCEKPDGAFYIMMNLDEVIGKSIDGVVITSSDDFAEKFLEKELVAIVPCTGFGFPNYVRWSYATSMENIQIGMKRLEKFVLSLK